MDKNIQKAYFAGGCFRGVEYHFQKLSGVISTTVGYMGGEKDNPTYEQVSGHRTGHVETVEVIFDSEKISYEQLAKIFFEIHDPTQAKGQGPDIGPQYLSIIFYTSQEQKDTAQKLISILKEKGYKVVTQVGEAGIFRKGENYHQDYYAKKEELPYCHIYTKKF